MQSYPFLSAKRASSHAFALTGDDPFDQDLVQITQAEGFRRLQEKTPSWIGGESNLCASQLTHSVETSYIGGILAKTFDFPQPVMAAAGLAHELGTPPLGPLGEAILRDFAREVSAGRVTFSSSAQTFRSLCSQSSDQRELPMQLTAAVLDALLTNKSSARGNCPEGGFYPEDRSHFQWVISQTQTHLRKSPLAILLEVADDMAQACRSFEDALQARHLIKERLLQEIHALLLAEPQLSQWCESCFLAPIAAMSPYQEIAEIKGGLKLRLMQAFFSQVAAVRRSPAFYVRLMTLDYPEESDREEASNLVYQYCPLLRRALEFLQQVVQSQVAQDISAQRLTYAKCNLMRDFLVEHIPLLVGNQPEHHPLMLSLPPSLRHQLMMDADVDIRLRAFLDYASGLTDCDLIQVASCLKGQNLPLNTALRRR